MSADMKCSKCAELEAKLKATEAIQNEQLNQCFRFEKENTRLKEQLQEQAKMLDYYRNKDD